MAAPKGHPKWGGKRKGTNNKKTISDEVYLDLYKQGVKEEFGPLQEAEMELAKGVYVIKPVKDSKGNIIDAKVYKEKPDARALEHLFSMTLGKPTEKIEHSGQVEIKKLILDQ